jgi:hypothetical protein
MSNSLPSAQSNRCHARHVLLDLYSPDVESGTDESASRRRFSSTAMPVSRRIEGLNERTWWKPNVSPTGCRLFDASLASYTAVPVTLREEYNSLLPAESVASSR